MKAEVHFVSDKVQIITGPWGIFNGGRSRVLLERTEVEGFPPVLEFFQELANEGFAKVGEVAGELVEDLIGLLKFPAQNLDIVAGSWKKNGGWTYRLRKELEDGTLEVFQEFEDGEKTFFLKLSSRLVDETIGLLQVAEKIEKPCDCEDCKGLRRKLN